MKLTFRSWIAGKIGRDDHIGDIAREAADDRCWTGSTSRSFLTHLTRVHRPSYPAVLAADDAVAMYRRALADRGAR